MSTSDQNHEAATPPANEPDPCPICRKPFSDTRMAQITYCGHVFCGPCIISWFIEPTSVDCPTCRSTMYHPCSHFCNWALLSDRPPIGPAPQSLLDNCIDCHLVTLSQAEIDELIKREVVYKEEEAIALMEWEHIWKTEPAGPQGRHDTRKELMLSARTEREPPGGRKSG